MTIQLLEHEYHQLLDLLRSWLTIDWHPDRSHPLHGGMSGATVTRLSMTWQNSVQTISAHSTGPGNSVGSTVVKVGDLATLAQTKARLAQIPDDYQDYFARIISGPHRLAQAECAYLLLEDLAGYATLYDALCNPNEALLPVVTEQLIAYLRRFYRMPAVANEQGSLIESLYLLPIDRIVRGLRAFRCHLLNFDERDAAIQDQLVALQQRCSQISNIPHTVMHGDLHPRNLMLCEIRPETGDIDFRLIDLDKFSRSGDLVYDLGELIIDIETSCANQQLPNRARYLCRKLETAMRCDAQRRLDHSFPIRLALSKARALLKLIEIQVKQIFAKLSQPHPPAFLIQANLEQVQHYLQQALALSSPVAQI